MIQRPSEPQQQWASTGRPGLARTVHVRSGAAGTSAAGAASSDESSATTERRTGGLRPLVVAVERPGEAVDWADGVDATTPAVGPHVNTRRAVSRGDIDAPHRSRSGKHKTRTGQSSSARARLQRRLELKWSSRVHAPVDELAPRGPLDLRGICPGSTAGSAPPTGAETHRHAPVQE